MKTGQKVAIVYDRINKFGGAERVLLALHELWPNAPLYTAVYSPNRAQWARVFEIHPSFLQHVPFAQTHHEWLPWLTPMAFESFDFGGFDLVISVTSAEAKNVLTKPGTCHICYCLTPTRYLWSGYMTYRSIPSVGMPDWFASRVLQGVGSTLRRWDRVASARPDHYIAISQKVAERIVSYYGRKPEAVVYPPVDVHFFKPKAKNRSTGYFLVVSRLVGYKRVDLVIDAFNELGWPLVIVGDGLDKDRLVKKARTNVTFVSSNLTDEELAGYYQDCRAFVFGGDEDFGLVAAEAQACGKPVVAYKNSGMAEIVLPGVTGELFDDQRPTSLIATLKKFSNRWYDSDLCYKNAQRFSVETFRKDMIQTVEMLYNSSKL